MKRYIRYIMLLCTILLVSGLAIAEQKEIDKKATKEIGQNYDIGAAPNIFTGDYLKIVINDGGVLGWLQSNKYETGLNPNSIYLDGYNIAYQKGSINNISYYYNRLGYPPPTFSNISIISNTILVNDSERAIKKTVIKTKDNALMMNFTFTFLKRYSDLVLETTITNIGTTALKGLVYKRIVDVDACGRVENLWESYSNAAVAKHQEEINYNLWTCSIITIAGTGSVPVSFVDLNADDKYTIGPGDILQSPGYGVTGDYSAIIHYNLGTLNPKASKTVYTSYQASFKPKHD